MRGLQDCRVSKGLLNFHSLNRCKPLHYKLNLNFPIISKIVHTTLGNRLKHSTMPAGWTETSYFFVLDKILVIAKTLETEKAFFFSIVVFTFKFVSIR